MDTWKTHHRKMKMKILRFNARLPQPRISQSLTDPLGSATRLSKMDKVITRKYKQLRTRALELFRTIPSSQTNAESSGLYFYDFSSARAATFMDDLQALIDEILLEGDDFGHGRMWANVFIGDAYQAGTQKANSELSSLSPVYAEQRPIAAILYSEPYLNRLQLAYTAGYSDWRGLSDYSRQQLASVIMEGIARGANPRDVEADIVKRVDVSHSYAKQIAQTEITGTLRQANRREVIEAREELGIETVMLWQSALLPGRTRFTHAARHGRFYSPEEIDTFYSEVANRRNCHCSQSPALLMDGKPVILESSQDRLDRQRESWEKVNKKKAK
ncbi:putative head assembly protein [Salmonella phage Segz_1]|uniref:Putative head assembly protein n=1 Tax=Salmonella phage Segz_1 TaxID=2419756 RepID=A0A411BAV1_9CAUD|nr:head morphogenesis [Salmonella phage Segz_1]QAX98723.1 putative head assembly protein [Salmonella phage Segz_1]